MANLRQEPVTSHINQEMLRSFRQLLESCFGPHGGVKMIITGGGLFACNSSSSSQVIKYLEFNHPILTLIINFIKSHQSVYEDNGLYVGIVSSHIIEQSWFHGRRNCSKVLKFVFDRCLALMEKSSIDVGLTSVNHLLAVTKTILTSKPACGISKENLNHLSVHIVKGFLSIVGAEAETIGLGRVIVMSQAGRDIQETELLDGVLYMYPEDDQLMLQLCKPGRPWKILLYTCMLNNAPTVAQEVDSFAVTSSLQHMNPMVQHFSRLVPELKKADIRLLACQKVVHPEIKLSLRRSGIVVLHRLGTELAKGLERISGAHAMDAPLLTEWQQCIGTLDAVVPITRHDKQYLHLKKESSDVSTLLLCCPLEKSADELEVVVRQAIGGLSQLMVQPKLVPGAGCLESWLASQLREDVESNAEGYNLADLQAVVTWVEKSLMNIPRILSGSRGCWELLRDSVSCHAWKEDAQACLCSSVSREFVSGAIWTEMPLHLTTPIHSEFSWSPQEKTIFDVYRCKASALKHAFDACQAILAIGDIIHL